jgi:hypothetical protein
MYPHVVAVEMVYLSYVNGLMCSLCACSVKLCFSDYSPALGLIVTSDPLSIEGALCHFGPFM